MLKTFDPNVIRKQRAALRTFEKTHEDWSLRLSENGTTWFRVAITNGPWLILAMPKEGFQLRLEIHGQTLLVRTATAIGELAKLVDDPAFVIPDAVLSDN